MEGVIVRRTTDLNLATARRRLADSIAVKQAMRTDVVLE
jgi:hypothetical protein